MESEKNATCQKEFCYDKNEKMKFKLYQKVRDHCNCTGKFRGAAHSIYNLNHKAPQEIPVKISNGSKYDYHFIIKELTEEFKGQFECLGENKEKCISFSVPIKKWHDNDKTITYKKKFIDTCIFMPVDYQILLITCLKLIIKIAKYAEREKMLNQNVNLLGLKVIDWITDAKSAMEYLLSQ